MESSENFDSLFESASFFTDIRSRALEGRLRDAPSRSVCWRVFLGVLSKNKEDWEAQLKSSRAEYDALYKKYMSDPRAQAEQLSADINNPLARDEDSPWQQFFQNEELQKQIRQDIVRTYPEMPFFQQESTRQMLLNILFIYAKCNPELEYRQGMHELLAPMLFLFHREATRCEEATKSSEEGGDSFVKQVLVSRYIEHDAHTLFVKLMEVAGAWFSPSSSTPSSSSSTTATSGPYGLVDPDDFDPLADMLNGEANDSQVVRKCKRIHKLLLKNRDPDLFEHFNKLDIEPQIYALRWIRLLFGREFHLEDVLILWDGIFAYDEFLGLVDHICIAMLVYIRTQLLENDYAFCLKRLFNYPPVEDVYLFIEKALLLASNQYVALPIAKPVQPQASKVKGTSSTKKGIFSAPNKILNTINNLASTRPVKTKSRSSHKQASPSLPKKNNKVAQVDAGTGPEVAKQAAAAPVPVPAHPADHPALNKPETSVTNDNLSKIQDLLRTETDKTKIIASMKWIIESQQATQLHMATRVERIIYIMQNLLDDEGSSDKKGLALAVAELKQVRDVLNGLLPQESISVSSMETNDNPSPSESDEEEGTVEAHSEDKQEVAQVESEETRTDGEETAELEEEEETLSKILSPQEQAAIESQIFGNETSAIAADIFG